MPLVLPLMRGGGLHFRVTLCWRGLCTTHIHRPLTTYFLFAKIITTFDSCKHLSKFYHPLHTFFFIFFANSNYCCIFANDSVSLRGLVGRNIDGMDVFSRCRARLRKGVYGRYCSVLSNFATLKSVTEVMQRNVCVGELYPDMCYISNICSNVLYI